MIIFTHLKCFYFCSYSFKNYFYLKNSYCNKNHHKKCFHYKVQAPQNVIYHFQKWNVLTWFLCQTCDEIQLHNGDTQENRHDFCGVAKRTLNVMETESKTPTRWVFVRYWVDDTQGRIQRFFGDTIFWNRNFFLPTLWFPGGKKITSF